MFFSSLIGDVLALTITLLVIFVAYWKWTFLYWHRRKVPYLEPQIPFGDLEPALRGKEHLFFSFKRCYDTMKSKGLKYGGIFMFDKPGFLPLDMDIIKNILIKDFEYFHDRDLYVNENDSLQAHLVNLRGSRWRDLRTKLTPAFSSGKLKSMFQAMEECQGSLLKRMEEERHKSKSIDVKEVLACFGTNIIGSCAFGLECNALEDENSEFRALGRKMHSFSVYTQLKRIFVRVFPNLAKLLDIRLSNKEVVESIMGLVKSTIDYREKNNYTRNDFLQILIDMKDSLTWDELASQCSVFYSAGFESSSTVMTYVLYELAKHQDIQDKARNEVNSVLKNHDGKISYDALQDMKYLKQVIDETMRMYPPGGSINRKCLQDYKVPGTDVVLEKGTVVFFSILGIHYDEEYYPNPTQFDPERFSEENKKTRPNYTHLPFGEGPRRCIGLRFGLLQSKMGLALLLKNYKFTVDGRTEEPLVYKPNSPVLSPRSPIWLNAQKL